MSRKRRTLLSSEGWYYLVVMGFILAGSLMREINLLIVLFGLMLGPLLVSWRMVGVSLRKIDIRRSVPKSITAGEPLVVDLHATNGRKRGVSWAVVAEDSIAPEGNLHVTADRARVLFSRLESGETVARAYQGRLNRRGRYTFGPVKLSTRFPLGLLQGSVVVDELTTITVLPRLGRLTPAWYDRQRAALEGSRSDRRRQGLIEGDFHSLRDYRPGDSSRWIHWRTSARHGELMVRQFEQQQSHDLALLLDLWQGKTPTREDWENVELAVSFAATVIADQCRQGFSQLLLGITGQRLTWTQGPASMVLLHEAMQELALARASSADSLPRLMEEGLSRVPPRCDVVLVSTRPVDLQDTTRFGPLKDDTRSGGLISRALCLDAGGNELFRYYQS